MAADFSPETYWQRRLMEHPGLEGVGFLGLGRNYNAWLYRLRARVFRRLVRQLKAEPEHLRVLDVGSGTGFYLDAWKKYNVREVVGSDMTMTAVDRISREFPGTRVVQFDIGADQLPEDIGTFDVISAFDVLFHITDDARYDTALRNVSALLRPGGSFLFSENFLHRDTERWPHQVSRSRSEIARRLDAAGLVDVERRPMMVLMNAPIAVRSDAIRSAWKVFTAPARLNEVLGWTLGALLFPVDVLLTRVLHESPTTEVCICRRTP